MSTFRFVIVYCLLTAPAFAQRTDRNYPPQLADAKTEVYKTASETPLRLYIFSPQDLEPGDQRPAVVFFFGGGWRSGSPGQFAEQSRYLAARGMVAICADYRVSSRQDVTPLDCVEDAKSAMAYVRKHAGRLGIDPQRIAAAGGSAGGHLAACVGVLDGADSAENDSTRNDTAEKAASSRANALVLFNPAVQIAAFEGEDEALRADAIAKMNARTGGRAKDISPIHHVDENEPPTLILHGVEDKTVPFSSVARFGEEMRKHGNRCEVVGFKDAGHGFFNLRRGNDAMNQATTHLMDEFFASLGWLDGEPAVEMPIGEDRLVREGFNTMTAQQRSSE